MNWLLTSNFIICNYYVYDFFIYNKNTFIDIIIFVYIRLPRFSMVNKL